MIALSTVSEFNPLGLAGVRVGLHRLCFIASRYVFVYGSAEFIAAHGKYSRIDHMPHKTVVVGVVYQP